jgi:hypothetical protein
MSDHDKRTTRRILAELFEHGQFKALDELVHPAFVNHEATPGNPQGREGLKETITWLHGLWGPMRATIHDDLGQALQLGLIGPPTE